MFKKKYVAKVNFDLQLNIVLVQDRIMLFRK